MDPERRITPLSISNRSIAATVAIALTKSSAEPYGREDISMAVDGSVLESAPITVASSPKGGDIGHHPIKREKESWTVQPQL
jgi:hypothetical protein